MNENTKNPHAVALGSLGGKAGRGQSKARKVTSEQARKAVSARWKWQYEVGYSYSSSPNACQLGFAKDGCWTVSRRRNATQSWQAIAGYPTKTEAESHLAQITTYDTNDTNHTTENKIL